MNKPLENNELSDTQLDAVSGGTDGDHDADDKKKKRHHHHNDHDHDRDDHKRMY